MDEMNSAFWKWFGDSQVVDRNDNPRVVYHGTDRTFYSFKVPAYFAENQDYAEFFTLGHGEVLPCYLRIQNALDLTRFGTGYIQLMEFTDYMRERRVEIDDFFENYYSNVKSPVWGFIRDITSDKDKTTAFLKRLSHAGFDGLSQMESNGTKKSKIWLVIKPSQVKLAENNDGSYDEDDDDIRSNPRRRNYQWRNG